MELESEDQARSILIGINVFETQHCLVKKKTWGQREMLLFQSCFK